MTRKQVEEERVYLAYSSIIVHHGMQSEQELKQGWNLEARTSAQATEGCCLLACS
jgi:type VI protein secretion system component Hcp